MVFYELILRAARTSFLFIPETWCVEVASAATVTTSQGWQCDGAAEEWRAPLPGAAAAAPPVNTTQCSCRRGRGGRTNKRPAVYYLSGGGRRPLTGQGEHVALHNSQRPAHMPAQQAAR